MTTREDVQNRIGGYEHQNKTLAEQAACLRRKAEENERHIAINGRVIAELRWAHGLDGAGPDAPKPREKVLVQPLALKALGEQPMTEEALIAHLGVSRKAVHNWIVRALREGKIRRFAGGLEVIA